MTDKYSALGRQEAGEEVGNSRAGRSLLEGVMVELSL